MKNCQLTNVNRQFKNAKPPVCTFQIQGLAKRRRAALFPIGLFLFSHFQMNLHALMVDVKR